MSEPTTDKMIEEQKVKDFFIAALQDETLLNQLMTALDAKDDAAILGLATERGYNFTAESLRQGLRNIANLIAPVALLKQE